MDAAPNRKVWGEALMVITAAVVFSSLFYIPWFQACCATAAIIAAVPAVTIAAIMGGGTTVTWFHFTFGVVIQFLAIWSLWRLIKRSTKGGADV